MDGTRRGRRRGSNIGGGVLSGYDHGRKVADLGRHGNEFLQILHTSKARHGPLSSPDGSLPVFGALVEVAGGLLPRSSAAAT